MGKEQKQFQLDSKENCCIYLCRIISSCELCMDKLEKYNNEAIQVLKDYIGQQTIPYDVYGDMCDKSCHVTSYLLNLLGDCQKTSISYFKYRDMMKKRIKKGNKDVSLAEMDDETSEILTNFNRMRNWQNHVPESLLIAETEMIKAGTLTWETDPVIITKYKYVEYEYYKDMIDTNISFFEVSKKLINVVKKDYALLMGKEIEYPRVYVDTPVRLEKQNASKKSAQVQGVKNT